MRETGREKGRVKGSRERTEDEREEGLLIEPKYKSHVVVTRLTHKVRR